MYCIPATGRIPSIVTKIKENLDDEQKNSQEEKQKKKPKKKSKKIPTKNGEALPLSKLQPKLCEQRWLKNRQKGSYIQAP